MSDRLGLLLQRILCEALQLFGRVHCPAPDGEGHFGNVYGAHGVHRNTVGSDELAGALTFLGGTE